MKTENQARTAETFIEAHLPRVFFIEVDPFAVIKRENEVLAGRAPAPPHADLDLLGVFSEFKPTSLNFFTARDLFTIVQDSGFAGRFADFASAMMRSLEGLRNGIEGDSRLRSGQQRLASDPRIQRGTRFILSALVRALRADKKTKITQNQAMDLIHAVVPVAYCAFVLLDKHWRAQVDGVRARFKKDALGVPIARVFSERKNGVDRFLSGLESS